jgi:hypothetical protein
LGLDSGVGDEAVNAPGQEGGGGGETCSARHGDCWEEIFLGELLAGGVGCSNEVVCTWIVSRVSIRPSCLVLTDHV